MDSERDSRPIDLEHEAAIAAVRADNPETTEGLRLRACYGMNGDHVEVEARIAQFIYRWSVYSREIRDAHERVVRIQRTIVDRGYLLTDELAGPEWLEPELREKLADLDRKRSR